MFNSMKTVRDYSLIPSNYFYIGGSYPDESIDESVIDDVENAIAPIKLIDDDDGTIHFFDIRGEQ